MFMSSRSARNWLTRHPWSFVPYRTFDLHRIPLGLPVGISLTGTLPDYAMFIRHVWRPPRVSRNRQGVPQRGTVCNVAAFDGEVPKLAHSWLRLAEDLERAEALLEQVKVPKRKAS
jgi:hypothetical protein